MRKPEAIRMPARPLYAVLGIALVALAAWGLRPRALPVETATVAVASVETGFTEEGRTRLRDRFVISAPVDGVVERITLEPGDAVTPDAPVALLRPSAAALMDPATLAEAESRWRTAGDERTAAQAAVAGAVAEHDRAEAALRRVEALAGRQQVSLDQLDDARSRAVATQSALLASRARLQAAESRFVAAKASLDLQGTSGTRPRHIALRSPVEGLVMRRHVESEGPVRAGQPLLEVGDPRSLEVVVDVLTEDALLLEPGLPVRLDAGAGVATLVGRVQSIEPAGFTKVSALGVEEQRVVVVVALPDGAPALGDAYRVDARFQVWKGDAVLAVPVPALFRDGASWAVYRVDDGRARLRRVEIGHLGDGAAEVSGGLAAGDRVVVYPGDRISDGMRVTFDPGRTTATDAAVR